MKRHTHTRHRLKKRNKMNGNWKDGGGSRHLRVVVLDEFASGNLAGVLLTGDEMTRHMINTWHHHTGCRFQTVRKMIPRYVSWFLWSRAWPRRYRILHKPPYFFYFSFLFLRLISLSFGSSNLHWLMWCKNKSVFRVRFGGSLRIQLGQVKLN